VLIITSYGYLAVEGRNNGLTRWTTLWRPFLVTLLGLAHGLMVGVIGLLTVVPAFAAKGRVMATLWSGTPSYTHQGQILLLTAAWCFAVGVFSQILWDDRPITAPLAHLTWRSGR
jgi:hypothetical protein